MMTMKRWSHLCSRLGAMLIVLTTTSTAISQEATTQGSSAKDVIRRLQKAMIEGDAAVVRDVFIVNDEQSRRFVDAMASTAVATASLRKAAVGAFGEQAVNPILGDPAAQAEIAKKLIDAAPEKTTAAGVEVNIGGEAAVFREVNGIWKLLPALSIATPEYEQRLIEVEKQAAAIQAVAQELSNGRYRSMQEVGAVLHARMMQAASDPKSTTKPAEKVG